MEYILRWILLVIITTTVSCSSTRREARPVKDDGKFELIFVQVNDVYEIAPTSGGKSGGMARVATIKKEYLKQNPNTFLVMAGDFLSPSVFNNLMHEGKRIRGKQMVESMNAAKTDIVIFGNHEFDISESELQERINESSFEWISSNSFHKRNGNRSAFQKTINNFNSTIPQTYILRLTDADGTSAKIGFIGITITSNKAEYVEYTDPFETADKLYQQIKDSCDAVVAITHMEVEDDIILAKRLPNLAVILGGHEHDMRFEKAGTVYITKAHANAKSAYIVKLHIDKNQKSIRAIPELKMLDENVAFDTTTDSVVTKWTNIANKSYSSLGFDPAKVVIASGDSLEGRESEARVRPTNFTDIIVRSMAHACPQSQVVISNAGSIRLDDILFPPITQYDILRSLPFGGPIREADIKGSLLIQTLNAGIKNIGTGAYLYYYPVNFDIANNKWLLNGEPIDSGKIYRVAFSDYLVTGKETNLEFLNKSNPLMLKLYDAESSPASSKSDVRLAIIRYLEKFNSN
jgi:2',3'-cyclic-nucleotide 2'-phosphodiesterase (5'-nucleotidase family)